jgi:hypothetical protein
MNGLKTGADRIALIDENGDDYAMYRVRRKTGRTIITVEDAAGETLDTIVVPFPMTFDELGDEVTYDSDYMTDKIMEAINEHARFMKTHYLPYHQAAMKRYWEMQDGKYAADTITPVKWDNTTKPYADAEIQL